MTIGLTGSIGMGKSTVAAQFLSLGAFVTNADMIVHRLMQQGGKAVPAIKTLFPLVIKDGAVNRKALGEIVFNDKLEMRKLEHILHPLVVAEEERDMRIARSLGAKFAVLDIPLLYETHAQTRFDLVVVATAPYFIQKQRVLKRPNMSEEKFQRILLAQTPDSEKRACADWIVQTGLGKAYSFASIATLLYTLGIKP